MNQDQFEFEFIYKGNTIEASCAVHPLYTLSIYTVVFNNADNVSSFMLYRESNGNFLWFDRPAPEQQVIQSVVKGLRTVKVK